MRLSCARRNRVLKCNPIRVTQELLAQLARRNDTFDQIPISAQQLGELIDLVQDGSITGTSAKSVLRQFFNTQLSHSTSISNLVDEMGLRANASTDEALRLLCEQAIKELPAESELVRRGNKNVLMKILGRVMKLSKGTADAKSTRTILEGMLKTDEKNG